MLKEMAVLMHCGKLQKNSICQLRKDYPLYEGKLKSFWKVSGSFVARRLLFSKCFYIVVFE